MCNLSQRSHIYHYALRSTLFHKLISLKWQMMAVRELITPTMLIAPDRPSPAQFVSDTLFSVCIEKERIFNFAMQMTHVID